MVSNWILLVDNGLFPLVAVIHRSQDLSALCAHCSWSVTAPRQALCVVRTRDTHRYIHRCTSMHTYIYKLICLHICMCWSSLVHTVPHVSCCSDKPHQDLLAYTTVSLCSQTLSGICISMVEDRWSFLHNIWDPT